MKIFNDILKHNGKYSRKSFYAFVAFFIAVSIEIIFPIFELPTKEYVFITFMTFCGSTLGLTVWDKKANENKGGTEHEEH